jgi:hypothetical protein
MVYLEFPSVTIASLLRFIVAYGRSSHGSRPKDRSLPNRSVRARVFRSALAGKNEPDGRCRSNQTGRSFQAGNVA